MGHRVLAITGQSRVYAAGRVCAAEGCETRLSIYNPQSFCALHAALRSRGSARGVHSKRRSRSENEG